MDICLQISLCTEAHHKNMRTIYRCCPYYTCPCCHGYCILQPGLTEQTRQAIGEAAVRAARAVNYVGAGESLAQWGHSVNVSRRSRNLVWLCVWSSLWLVLIIFFLHFSWSDLSHLLVTFRQVQSDWLLLDGDTAVMLCCLSLSTELYSRHGRCLCEGWWHIYIDQSCKS